MPLSQSLWDTKEACGTSEYHKLLVLRATPQSFKLYIPLILYRESCSDYEAISFAVPYLFQKSWKALSKKNPRVQCLHSRRYITYFERLLNCKSVLPVVYLRWAIPALAPEETEKASSSWEIAGLYNSFSGCGFGEATSWADLES